MGQAGSSHSGLRLRRRSMKQLTLGGITKKHSHSSKNLSHAFSFVDGGLKLDQLNINTATEEELMTLPSVNRTLARNIVNHRQAIGRFHRVEDVALVSGIGAHKLELIRPEICICAGDGSQSSSRASISLDSLANGGCLVDVNTASVFALQAVPGLNQELAASIVERRSKRGPYRSLDDLIKVRGIGKHRLAAIKPYLKVVVDSDGTVTLAGSNGISPLPWSNPQAASTPIVNGIDRIPKAVIPRMNGVSRTHVAQESKTKPAEFCSGISEEDIWELLSVASPRPLTPSNFSNKLEGRTSVRIATWNLDNFSTDKASNPGVREVVCRTILENRFSILALQEIENAEALTKLIMELNTPSLKRVRDWQANRRTWRSSYLGGGLAILWNADSRVGISLREQHLVTPDLLPLAASVAFYINKFKVTITNVQTRSPRDKKIIQDIREREHSVILGDFSCLTESDDFDLALPAKENTALRADELYFNDNICWGKDSKSLFDTGVTGIVRQGLTHLGIPYGWKWGGPASNHCPVWCQIYSQSNEQ